MNHPHHQSSTIQPSKKHLHHTNQPTLNKTISSQSNININNQSISTTPTNITQASPIPSSSRLNNMISTFPSCSPMHHHGSPPTSNFSECKLSSSSMVSNYSNNTNAETSNNERLAELLSNLMKLNAESPSPTSILLQNLTNKNNALPPSSSSSKCSPSMQFPHVQYPSLHKDNKPPKVSNPFHSQQHVQNRYTQQYQHETMQQNMMSMVYTAQENRTLESFNDQTWSCLESQENHHDDTTGSKSLLIRPISPSSFNDFIDLARDCSNENRCNSIPQNEITVSDLFHLSPSPSPTTNSHPTLGLGSEYSVSSNFVCPVDYSNNNLIQKQLIVDYYTSLLQSRFQQVFGSAIQYSTNEDQSFPQENVMLTTQQFVYVENPLNEKFRKPLNLKLDLSEEEIESMRSQFGKHAIHSSHSSPRNQRVRKNSITSAGSMGKQISKKNKMKSSPTKKGRKCQAVPNNFSPLNEETGHWRFFSYNGDVNEAYSMDQEESPSKLVFYKFNPVK